MTDNKNDNRNHQSDSKSHLEKTQEGKKKEEINPNNPTANQKSKQDSNMVNQKGQNSSSPKGASETDVQDTEEENEKSNTVKSDIQKNKKGNM